MSADAGSNAEGRGGIGGEVGALGAGPVLGVAVAHGDGAVPQAKRRRLAAAPATRMRPRTLAITRRYQTTWPPWFALLTW